MASGMLASLRNYRPNRKKTPSKSPFSLGKRSDPGSPSAYGSQVFDIGESSYEERDLDPTSSVGRIYEVPKSLPPEPVVSPRVDVDIEQTPADWFPSHFLKTDSIAGPSSLAAAANTIAAATPKTKSVETFDNDAGSEGEEDEEDEEEDDDDLSISTGEEFVANLESMDASNFLSLPPSDPSTLPSVIAARKPAPTPIKIPNASLHGPRVQLVRSATAQSRPESMFSLDGASAVSGTTLARALIGDSFVLSADRSSRYRSGASVLTRSDSATLPRGEHPFSPAWSARRSGAFTPIDSMGKPIPPVPQMPEELRALIAESRDRLKVGGSGSGAGSDGGSASPGTPLVRSNSGRVLLSADPAVGAEGEDEDGADRASRRISRISEAPTPTSSLPFTPNDPPDTAETSPDPASSSSHAPEPPVTPASTAQNFHHPAPSPSAFPASPGQSSTSDTRSSRDLDNVLDYYNFENSPYSSGPGQSMFDLPSPEPGAEGGMGGAMANGMRYHPAFSPITEESGSQLSPNSFRSRRTPSGVGTLASTPSPSTGSGRVEWRPGESQTIRSLPPHPQSATATLLPIGGDRRGSGSIAPPPLIIPPGPPYLNTNLNNHSHPVLPTVPSALLASALASASSPNIPTIHARSSSFSSLSGDNTQAQTQPQSLVPPSRANLFSANRAGPAPSPIRVVRDSRDATAYNITVTPGPLRGSPSSSVYSEGGGGEPGTPESLNGVGGERRGQQTFPETPSAFSPTFSPNPSDGGEGRNSMMQPPPMPGSAPGAGYTSLAQQVLLTRAATTVRGARHSRQASVTRARNRSTAIFSSAGVSMLKEVIGESPVEESPVEEAAVVEEVVVVAQEVEKEKENGGEDLTPRGGTQREGEDAKPPLSDPPDSASIYSVQVFPSPPRAGDRSLHRSSVASEESHWASLYEAGTSSMSDHDKPLPPMPTSPLSPEEPAVLAPVPMPAVPLVKPEIASLKSASTSSLSRPSGSSPPISLSRRSSYRSTSSPSLPERQIETPPPPHAPTPPPPRVVPEPEPPASPPPARPSLTLSPPTLPLDSTLGSPHIIPVLTPAPRAGDISPIQPGLGSPPPYYTVMYDREGARDHDRMTPSTGGSGGYGERDAFSPMTPSMPLREQRGLSFQSIGVPPTPGRRQRARPPLPIGPRRPSASATVAPAVGGRNRNGSVSSIASNMPTGRRLQSGASPRFQTPPLKWRGYTMDAAKWTFSSAQLQGIVSRAIRQSAEASSIRLLRLETVDKEIPDELHRLEMQRTDVKTRYKMLTRRRANLFATLTSTLDGTEAEDPTYALRIVENLKEIAIELDRLAEDLHSADEQIDQLSSLRDVHSASALAMALRKLNASFLKQIAETEALRQQVETLQAERDEAWSQAVDVANEYDDLNERMEMNSPGPSSYNKRSSRVLAVKKSSIRVSKAGLRSSSRRSSVSSIGGNRTSSSGLPSASFEDIPPVPPIPRRRPEDIKTDLASRASVFSTTPTSETRALDRAQDELYSMLGISVPERFSRRSHSVIMSAGSDTENPILSSLASARLPSSRRRSDASRPSSLPGNSALSGVLSAMTADRNAMLATLGMLDD